MLNTPDLLLLKILQKSSIPEEYACCQECSYYHGKGYHDRHDLGGGIEPLSLLFIFLHGLFFCCFARLVALAVFICHYDPLTLKTVLLFMIRFAGVDLECSVDLLEQHYPRKLMRQSYPAKAHPEVCPLLHFI